MFLETEQTRIVGFFHSMDVRKDENPLKCFSLAFPRFPQKSKNRLNTSLGTEKYEICMKKDELF